MQQRIKRLQDTIEMYLKGTDKNTQFHDACKIAEWSLIENALLLQRNKELVEALNGIVNNWTERMGGDSEVWKDGKDSVSGMGYYSPSSSMVSSEFIAKAKVAIENNKPKP
jgi:hypothetical protein